MKTVLVTGGSGFIGSHTCLVLLKNGFQIYVIDSFINSSAKSLEKVLEILKNIGIDAERNIKLFNIDLKNDKKVEEIFHDAHAANQSIEAVIHFAGLKSVSESISKPLKYWENNVIGTINLLKIMGKYNCKTIVFSSSATVYKAKANKLLNENDICEPVNPYGYTKLTIERILGDLYNSDLSEWRIASLRYFNPVGAHYSGLIGEDPSGKPNNIYPQITKVAIGKLDEIKIFGSDWPTKDGTGIRDYIHVMDLAEGHFSALNYLSNENPQYLILNLGTGRGTSVLELIKTFQRVNNVNIPYKFDSRRQGDNAFVVADISKAKLILNWEPKASIEDICRNGWNWQLKNPNGY